jgi:hypothetical protein
VPWNAASQRAASVWIADAGHIPCGVDEDAAEIATPTRRFSVFEITSGLPDDNREEDERGTERQVRDLRGRVKRARAVVATTPGLAEILQRDWQKAARFYVRFGFTETLLRHGGPGSEVLNDDHDDRFRALRDDLNEPREREAATLPERGNER